MGSVVYVIGGDTGPLKIGITGNLAGRLAVLQTASHVRLKVHDYWRPDSAFQIERSAHAELAHCRLAGEWFDASLEEIRDLLTRLVGEVGCKEREEIEDKKASAEIPPWLIIEPSDVPAIRYVPPVCGQERFVGYVNATATPPVEMQIEWIRNIGALDEAIFIDEDTPRGRAWWNFLRFIRPGDTVLLYSAHVVGDGAGGQAITNIRQRGIRVLLCEELANAE